MLVPARFHHYLILATFVAGCGSSPANEKQTTPIVSTSASAVSMANSATVTPPAVPEEDFSAWVGSYPFAESTTGYAWAYLVKIEKMPEGYRAHFSLDGNQVAMHVLCTLRNAGPNKVDILYLRDEEGNADPPRAANEHLLSLEKVNGKVEYRWAAIKANIEAPKEGPAEIGDAKSYVKKYPVDFLAVKAVKARLDKLLGAVEYKRFDEFIATQDVIKQDGDLLVMEGFYPHSGGSQKAMVLYDMKNDKLHVMLSDEEGKTMDAYSEKWNGLPKGVEDRIKAWSFPGLKVVRHKK